MTPMEEFCLQDIQKRFPAVQLKRGQNFFLKTIFRLYNNYIITPIYITIQLDEGICNLYPSERKARFL